MTSVHLFIKKVGDLFDDGDSVFHFHLTPRRSLNMQRGEMKLQHDESMWFRDYSTCVNGSADFLGNDDMSL